MQTLGFVTALGLSATLGFFLRIIWDKTKALEVAVKQLVGPKVQPEAPQPSTLVEPLSPIQEAARRLRGDVDRLNQ